MNYFTCGTSHLINDPSHFGRWIFSGLVKLAYNPTDLSHIPLGEDGSTRSIKPQTYWFMPSDCPTKRKVDTEAHGNYCLLVADLDDGNHAPENVAGTLLDLGVGSFVIYDTLSSTKAARRHRVVIELAKAVNLAKWLVLQRALIMLFDADPCALKPNQISYMPTLSACNKDCYTVTTSDGLPLDPGRSRFALEADALEAEQPAESTATPKQPYVPTDPIALDGEKPMSPIAVFNQVNSWDSVLEYCGFKRLGGRWLSPTSRSGVPGAIVSYKVRQEGAYLSSHTSDPLADGLPHNKFDVWIVHGKGLDHRNAAHIAMASAEFARDYRLPDGYTLEAKNRFLFATQSKREGNMPPVSPSETRNTAAN